MFLASGPSSPWLKPYLKLHGQELQSPRVTQGRRGGARGGVPSADYGGERGPQHDERGDRLGGAALQPPRGADAKSAPHEQPQIEGGGVYEEPLRDVGVAVQVRALHPARLVEMGVRLFETQTALALEGARGGSGRPRG